MIALLLLSLSAHAHDLDIEISVHGSEPVARTLRDVRPGVLRGFDLPGEEHDHRVLVQLQQDADAGDMVTVTLTIEAVDAARRRIAVESRPRVTVGVDQPTTMGIDVRLPDSRDGAEPPVAEGAEIRLVVHDPAAGEGETGAAGE